VVKWLGIAAFAVVIAALPAVVPQFVAFELTYAAAYAIAIVGLVILIGRTGQISLGHGAFVAVGGYTLAILVTHGVPYGLGIVAAALIAGLLGVALGGIALRLAGVYLALATFALANSVAPVLKRFSSLTGGAQGLSIPSHSETELYYLTWGVAALLFALAYFGLRSRVGLALRALRDSEIAAVSFGVNPVFYKTLAFGWSSAYAGVAGALLALATAYVSPDVYSVALSLNLLVGAVIGGLQLLWGALLGGLVIEFFPLWSQAISPALAAVVYGIALILIMMFMPGGIAGALGRRMSFIRRGHE
jgi:branched-chain amino acid transport system permease protein